MEIKLIAAAAVWWLFLRPAKAGTGGPSVSFDEFSILTGPSAGTYREQNVGKWQRDPSGVEGPFTP